MTWGFFGPVHIMSLIIGAALIVGLHYLLKNRSQKTQIITLLLLSLSGIIAVVYNLIVWGSPVEYLPLHLCALNAMVLPFAVVTRNKTLNNLLLLWSLGALAAIVVNNAQANYELCSLVFAMYYFPHLLEFGIPILMFTLGLVEKDVNCIKSTLGITICTYTIVHCINIALNEYLFANNIVDYAGNLMQVNYMYSIFPENPVFDLFYSWIPYSYWYVLLTLPIILVYLLAIYSKEIINAYKTRRMHMLS